MSKKVRFGLLSVFILVWISACGQGGDTENNTTVTPPEKPPITSQLNLTGVVASSTNSVLSVNGSMQTSRAVIADSVANGEGKINFPYANNQVEGNITLSVTATDPDGINKLELVLVNINQAFVLCEQNCQTPFEQSIIGINPYLSGISPGEFRLELWLTDNVNNAMMLDAININWQPYVISGVSASKEQDTILISWLPNNALFRYNLYGATEQNLTPLNVLSLENGVQFLSLPSTSQSFTTQVADRDYHMLITGIDGGGESGFSSQFIVPATGDDVNFLPQAVADAYNLPEDTIFNGNVLDNDFDEAGDVLLLDVNPVVYPQNGTLTLTADGGFSYQPVANFFGIDNFVYQISDPQGASAQAYVTLVVSSVNDAPFAGNDTFLISDLEPLNVAAPGILTNDSDIDNDNLTVDTQLVQLPQKGQVTIASDGSFIYQATEIFSDSDSFVYQISDGNGGTAQGIVTITGAVQNQPPVAVNDSYQINEDTSLIINSISGGILANDSDPDSDPITLSEQLLIAPMHGQLILATDGTFSYIPDANFFGNDQFQYQISDPGGLTSSAFVNIEVLAQIDAPIALTDHYNLQEDSVLTIAAFEGVLSNDTDPDLSDITLNLDLISEPSKGVISLLSTGAFSYQPETDFNGVDTFIYQITNTQGLTSSAQVNLQVEGTNDLPLASDDSYQIGEDDVLAVTNLSLGLLANDTDIDGDILEVNVLPVVAPQHGIVELNANGLFIYTPEINFSGVDQFVYQITDGQGGSASALVLIDVIAATDAPIALADQYTLPEDKLFNVSAAEGLLVNDVDPDGLQLIVNTIPHRAPEHGVVNIAADGSFSYQPDGNFNGSDTFAYQVSNAIGLTSIGEVSLTIVGQNDAPIAVDDHGTIDEDLSAVFDVLANDTDADNNSLSLVSATASTGSVDIEDNQLTYVPDNNFNGIAIVNYHISDGFGGNDSALLTIEIQPVNDAPDVLNDETIMAINSTLLIDVLANDEDVDGDTLSLISVTATSGDAQISDNKLAYTSASGFIGVTNVSYQVSDGHGATAQGNANITVSDALTSPIANSDTYHMDEDTILEMDVLQNDVAAFGELSILNASAALGTVEIINNKLQFQPQADHFGTINLSYDITDGSGVLATGGVTVIIKPVNDMPIALDDTAQTNEDTEITLNVLVNDTDVDNDSLTIVDASSGSGDVSVLANQLVFTPIDNFNGLAAISYQILDGKGGSAAANVNVTVLPVNDAPVANIDSVTINEGSQVTINALTNDTDVDNDQLIITSVTVTEGIAEIIGNEIFYTAISNSSAQVIINYSISDGNGASDSSHVTVNITQVNDAPIANPDFITIDEDTNVIIDVVSNDTDPDEDSLTLINASVVVGSVSILSNKINYQPLANYFGNVTIDYEISDGNGAKSSSTVLIEITGINDNPIANPDIVSTAEETQVIIDVINNDTDIDGDVLTITDATASSGILLLVNNQLQFTPEANTSGSVTIHYTISDGNGGADSSVVTVNIIGMNDLPIALPDIVTTNEDTAIMINALANDSDDDGDVLTIVSAVASSGGTSLIGNQIQYTPAANVNGVVVIDYLITDGNSGNATSQITVNINSVNDLPIANPDNVTTAEDTAISINALANDSDVDGDTLTIISVTASSGSASIENGMILYLPPADVTGVQVINYSISDGNGGSAVSTITINVGGVNDAPVANADSVTMVEDSEVNINAIANDTDSDGDTLIISSVNVSSGSVNIINNKVNYIPEANFNGSVTINYSISDGSGGTASSTIQVTVTAINDAPIANPDTVTITEDTLVTINVVANDQDVENDLLVIIQATASSGVVNIVNDQLSFMPASDMNGTVNINYTVSDGNGGSANAQVTVTVTAVNDTPEAINDIYTINEDEQASFNVLGNDVDVDGDVLTITSVSTLSGTATIQSNQINYQPALDINGSHKIDYMISDPNGSTANGVVTVTIVPVNDNPIAVNDTVTVNEDTLITIDVLANDTDVDNDPLTLINVSTDLGSVVINNNKLEYTGPVNGFGTASITYSINDGNGGVDSALVTVIINAVNDVPIANNDSLMINEDAATTIIDVLLNDTDIDNDSLTLAGATVNVGTVAIVDNKINYSVLADHFGTAIVNYDINDGNGGTASAVLTIIITAVNDAPIAVNDIITINEDVFTTIDALANDTDSENDNLIITGASADKGVVSIVSNKLDYTPAVNDNGIATISYSISDGNGGADSASVIITITPVNDVPIANNDSLTINEDAATIAIDVLLNDTDSDNDLLNLVGATADKGTLIITNNKINYTVQPNYFGTAIVNYDINDGNGGTASGVLTLTINAVNDNPVAVNDVYNLDEDNVLNATISVLANDSDIEGDTLTVNTTPTSGPANGLLVLLAGGTFTYTPNLFFNGVDSFNYQISDGQGGVAEATVTLNIGAINNNPVAVNDTYIINEDGTLIIISNDPNKLTSNDSDVEGDNLTVNTTAVNDVDNGVLSLNNDGSFTYTPDANFNGSDSFIYQITDGNGGSAQATANITINAVNDAPTFNAQSFSIGEDATNGNVVGTLAASDIESDTLTYTIVGGDTGLFNLNSSTAQLTVNGTSPFNYEVDNQHTVNVDVTDNGSPNQSTSATITVNLNNVVEPEIPVETSGFGRTTEGHIELGGVKIKGKLLDSHRDGGNIYFVGYAENIDKDIYMTAYDNDDGELISGFGSSGELIIDMGADETVTAISEKGGKYYIAYDSYNGVHTEVCFIKIDTSGVVDSATNGGAGVNCTSAASDYSIKDMIYDGTNFWAVGRKRSGGEDDLLTIKMDDDLIFAAGYPLVEDVSGANRNDEGTAIYEIDGDKILLTGSVVSASGDKDIFVKHFDKDGVVISGFNSGNTLILDIAGTDDVITSIGGKTELSYTAYLAGYTLVSGKKESLIVALDNTGTLVTAFDNDGKATYDIDAGAGYSEFTGVEYDGTNIVTSGSFNDGSENLMFSARVSLPSGALDTTNYNSAIGYRKIDFSGTDSSYGLSLSLDGGDTAWVSGYRDVSGDTKLAIAAVNSSGGYYTDFSSNGKKTITYTSSVTEDDVAEIIKLKVSPNVGKYMVAGIANDSSNDHLIVGRLTSAGVLDTSFSGDGKQQIKAATSTLVSGVLEQNDGKIIVYGTMTQASVKDGFIARLNTDGSLDANYATNGMYKTTGIAADHISLTKAAFDNSGNVVAVGTLDNGVSNSFLMRVNIDGDLDAASFNASLGYVTGTGGDNYNDLVIDSGNNIYVAGERLLTNRDFLVQKYDGSGALVTGFNSTGTKVVDINGSVSETLTNILKDAAGNLYLVGNEPTTPNQIAVVKMSTAGVLDTSFSGDGITSLVMAPSSNNAMVYDAKLDSTGRIVIAGYSIVSGTKQAMFGRIKTDGSLDTGFGTAAGAGHYQATTCTLDEQFNSMVLIDDITAIVAGKCNTATELNNIGFSKYGFWEDGIAQ